MAELPELPELGSESDSSRAAIRQAERAVGSRAQSRDGKRFLGFVAAVVVIGCVLVTIAWNQRQYEYPTLFDSWQNAYGVYDCQTETWLDPFESKNNPNGIRSRGDGVVYIEPTDESVAGSNAQLHVLLDAVGARLSDNQMVMPDGTTLSEQGVTCGGEDAVLQVLRWDSAISHQVPVEVRTKDLGSTRFLADRQSIVIALAPAGTTISAPPSAAELVELDPS